MRFLDLFSGIGGFRMGMQRNKHEPVGYIERDKFARKSYEAIYDVRGEWTAKDVQQVEPEEIPDFDVLCAGFPCQDFSSAGKERGLEGTRGTLFYEIGRIAKVKRPKYLFLENVKNLLGHDEGKTFGTILKSLGALGYDVEWQLLNSKNFGVPQNRERVYIIGHFGRKSERTIFPLSKKSKTNYKKHRIQPIDDYNSNYRNIFSTVRQTDGVKTPRNGQKIMVKPVLTPDYINKGMNKKSQIGSKDGTMFTVDSTSQHGILKDGKIRKLTSKECWRLQGFPDWTYKRARVVNSATQLYRQAGNAVTVNVVEAIAERLTQQ